MSPDCSRECLIRYFSPISEDFGHEVGSVLSFKFASATAAAGAYKVEFVNYSAENITKIEEFLTAFNRYERHRMMAGTGTGTSRHVYWYETTSDKTRLGRHLRLMLDHMGVNGQTRLEQISFIVTRRGATQ